MPKGRPKSKLLLDTHAWIWIVNGDDQLRKSSSFQLLQKEIASSEIYVSVISVWEVSMLEQKGRISFKQGCAGWVQSACDRAGIAVAELTPTIAIESTQFETAFHGDPADRIIFSTAMSLGATLVTRDQKIISFAKKKKLPIFKI